VSVLAVRNLRVRFDTPRGPVHAVESISFDVGERETVAIVGESGSGKSVTALALLALLPRPSAVVETGEAWLDGRNLLAMSERELRAVRGRDVGMVFQDASSALHPLITVGEQIAETLRVHERVSSRAAHERAVAALAEVGVADAPRRAEQYPHELSGGMRQRALIAMALICRPKLLIADEPTTALDVTVQAQIMALLRELQARHGTAILFISHDLGLVADCAARVHVMYAGSIVESARTRELFSGPAHPYSAGLLGCVPTLRAPLDRPLASIPGTPPEPGHELLGCAFAPRCALATDTCRSTRPALQPTRGVAQTAGSALVLASRRVACFESERVLAGGAR
jgi:oligopeptide/dipeptide ABC transporter ATP-binding protein